MSIITGVPTNVQHERKRLYSELRVTTKAFASSHVVGLDHWQTQGFRMSFRSDDLENIRTCSCGYCDYHPNRCLNETISMTLPLR